jgi:molybdenum cofactor cytidylyltransferase
MNLIEALQPKIPTRIAIVGGGGKTTTLFQIGRQIEGLAWLTTTTHLGTDQLEMADKHFIFNSPEEIDLRQLKAQKVSLITGPFTPDKRVRGPSPEVLAKVVQLSEVERTSVIVEADGARSRPAKAPAQHEPSIPEWAEVVIVAVGLSALGKPLSSEWVHRKEQFAAITGMQENQLITIESLAEMLVHPSGGLKGIPTSAQKIVLFNQADTSAICNSAKKVVQQLLTGGYDKVIIGGLTTNPQGLAYFCK